MFWLLQVLRWKDLKIFDTGDKVKEASILLAKHGSSLKPTEEFTIAMRSAVKAFQKKQGLEQTGIINKKTWKALHKNT